MSLEQTACEGDFFRLFKVAVGLHYIIALQIYYFRLESVRKASHRSNPVNTAFYYQMEKYGFECVTKLK